MTRLLVGLRVGLLVVSGVVVRAVLARVPAHRRGREEMDIQY